MLIKQKTPEAERIGVVCESERKSWTSKEWQKCLQEWIYGIFPFLSLLKTTKPSLNFYYVDFWNRQQKFCNKFNRKRLSLWENHLRVAEVWSAKPQTRFTSSNFHPQRESQEGSTEESRSFFLKAKTQKLTPKWAQNRSAIAVNANHVWLSLATSQNGIKSCERTKKSRDLLEGRLVYE